MERKVGVAEIKARLSENLGRVRRGETVIVLDRATPIARIVPFTKEGGVITIRKPRSPGGLGRLRLPPAVKMKVDVAELLLQGRESQR